MKTAKTNATTNATTNAMIAVLLLFAAAGATPARAQDLLPKAAPQDGPIWIVNAVVHRVAGDPIENGAVRFEDGRITDVVSSRPKAVRGERTIDADGRALYPGFVCAASVMGLAEVGAVDMTIDTRERASVSPEAHALLAVNPDSWHIPVARRNGVLTCGVMPQGGLVSGRASVIRLDGWTWEDLGVEADAGLCVQWPFFGSSRFRRFRGGGGDPMEAVERIDALFDDAEAYREARDADPALPVDVRYEAMMPVLAGDKPVFVSATTLRQIETAIDWAAERGVRIVVVGGRDAALCAERLAEHDVPVILTSAHRMPRRRDLPPSTTFELPAILEETGVRWCMSLGAGSTASSVRNLPYEAAACIAYGLDPAVALRSITLSAAECLGVDDRLGTIEEGKLATFFLADGDPFELSTTIERAWIDGREILLEDKQTALYEKYRAKYRQMGLLDD